MFHWTLYIFNRLGKGAMKTNQMRKRVLDNKKTAASCIFNIIANMIYRFLYCFRTQYLSKLAVRIFKNILSVLYSHSSVSIHRKHLIHHRTTFGAVNICSNINYIVWIYGRDVVIFLTLFFSQNVLLYQMR